MNCHINEQGLVKVKDVVDKMVPHRIVENTSLSVILHECEKRDVHPKIEHELLSVAKNMIHAPLDTPGFFVQNMLEMTLAVLQFYHDSCKTVYISDACEYHWILAAQIWNMEIVEQDQADLLILSTEHETNLWIGDEDVITDQKVHWDITHGGLFDFLQDQKQLRWDSATLWIGNIVSPDLSLKVVLGTSEFSMFDQLDTILLSKCYFGLLHLGTNGVLSQFMARCRTAHEIETLLGSNLVIQAVQDPRGYEFETPLEPVPTLALCVTSKGPVVSIRGATPYCRMERWKMNVPLMETATAISIAVPAQDNTWAEKIAKELVYNLDHGYFHHVHKDIEP